MIISDVAIYRAGKVDGQLDYRNGASYSEAYPRTASDSYLAGWMAGWDSAAVPR